MEAKSLKEKLQGKVGKDIEINYIFLNKEFTVCFVYYEVHCEVKGKTLTTLIDKIQQVKRQIDREINKK